eukprot:1265203-Heterocapsa_arctica.AAC.1
MNGFLAHGRSASTWSVWAYTVPIVMSCLRARRWLRSKDSSRAHAERCALTRVRSGQGAALHLAVGVPHLSPQRGCPDVWVDSKQSGEIHFGAAVL